MQSVPKMLYDTSLPPVMFYKKEKPFYEFSNFHMSSLKLEEKEWSCVEQYFQAMKFYIPESNEHMEYFDHQPNRFTHENGQFGPSKKRHALGNQMACK